jgi:hypothetical protein
VESYVFVEGVLDWHREREFGLAFFFFLDDARVFRSEGSGR